MGVSSARSAEREGHAHGTEGRDGEFSDVEWKR